MTDTLAVNCARSAISAADGYRILADTWQPQSIAIRGVIQVVHGLSEHAARYERFAHACTEQGYAVVAHSHRGHGESRPDEELGHYADEGGWQRVIDDLGSVHDAARYEFPGLPCVLFAHSMGTYIAQNFLMQRPDAANALVLSGSTHAPRLPLYAGRLGAALERWRHGPRHRSALLNQQAFGAFNRNFEPARTAFDWLSRDAAEVDRYVDDPACGAIPSAQLWHDLLGGLLTIGKRSMLRRIPAGLPILITGGSDDPVGGRRGMQRLYAAYRNSGHINVALKVYDGGRHEMLNETNREEFTADVLAWIGAQLGGD